MDKVAILRRVAGPFALVCLLCTGACAMYDVNAFTEPEDAEEIAATPTSVATQPATTEDTTTGDDTTTEDTTAAGIKIIAHSTASLTLAWDASESTITGYRVAYRTHIEPGAAGDDNDDLWKFLAEVGAGETEYAVAAAALDGSGDYDFGVRAVNDTALSEWHKSIDSTASPTTGWCVRWTVP